MHSMIQQQGLGQFSWGILAPSPGDPAYKDQVSDCCRHRAKTVICFAPAALERGSRAEVCPMNFLLLK